MGSDLTAQRHTRGARRRWPRRLVTGAAGLVALVLVSGCSHATVEQLKRLGLPVGTSSHGKEIETLWIGSWIAAGAIGVLVWGLIIWAVVRYRRRSDDEIPLQTRYNLPIELLYTVAPVIVVAVLFFHTVRVQDDVIAVNTNADHHILVVGQQWAWTFDYLGEQATGGQNVYDVGTPASLATLWLVKGETVEFTLHSADVVHSFWVPAFYFKRDVIPGRVSSFSLTPTRLGTYAGRCAELCGVYHSRMLFNVKVVTRSAFDRHMRALQAAGQVGKPMGTASTSTIVGLNTGGSR